MFCKKCKSLMFPQGDYFICKKCGYKREKKHTGIIYKEKGRETTIVEDEKLFSYQGWDSSSHQCKKCGKRKSLSRVLTSGSELITIYKCLECGYVERIK